MDSMGRRVKKQGVNSILRDEKTRERAIRPPTSEVKAAIKRLK